MPIRIGIVGCGRILAAHLRGYRLLREAGFDDFRITALCARKEDDARMYVARGEGPPQRTPVSDIAGDPLAIGDEYLSDFQPGEDVAVFTDYREMIAEGPIDAVNDFTTHELHHQVAAEAFRHGKHLLTQKPLAVSVRAAEQMCRQAETAGCVFGVFENVRNSPLTRHLHWLFHSGRGGDLQMMLLTAIGVWWAPNLIVAETPWRHRRDEGGGLALDLGVHFFDQIRYLAGEVETVTAQTSILEPVRYIPSRGEAMECDADDTFFASFTTEQGVIGNLAASWGGHAGAMRLGEGPVYYGTKARTNGGRVHFEDGSEQPLAELYVAESDAGEREKVFPLGLDNAFALNQLDWLQAIREQREPETSGREGLRDLATAFGILESATAGCRVLVSDVLSGSRCRYQQAINERYGF